MTLSLEVRVTRGLAVGGHSSDRDQIDQSRDREIIGCQKAMKT